jgi:hypothetical protein
MMGYQMCRHTHRHMHYKLESSPARVRDEMEAVLGSFSAARMAGFDSLPSQL